MTYTQRVAQAVADEDWQKFRISLKGKTTIEKLCLLECYMIDKSHYGHGYGKHNIEECVVCIRVDNYIKALCRGGQLKPGTDLEMMVFAWRQCNEQFLIKK